MARPSVVKIGRSQVELLRTRKVIVGRTPDGTLARQGSGRVCVVGDCSVFDVFRLSTVLDAQEVAYSTFSPPPRPFDHTSGPGGRAVSCRALDVPADLQRVRSAVRTVGPINEWFWEAAGGPSGPSAAQEHGVKCPAAACTLAAAPAAPTTTSSILRDERAAAGVAIAREPEGHAQGKGLEAADCGEQPLA